MRITQISETHKRRPVRTVSNNEACPLETMGAVRAERAHVRRPVATARVDEPGGLSGAWTDRPPTHTRQPHTCTPTRGAGELKHALVAVVTLINENSPTSK